MQVLQECSPSGSPLCSYVIASAFTARFKFQVANRMMRKVKKETTVRRDTEKNKASDLNHLEF